MDGGGGRECDAHFTAGILLDPLIRQPFGEELLHIHEVSRGIHINLGIAGPGIFLSGGAIHGNIQEITLLTPPGIFHQLVDQFIGTMELAGFLHVGIDGNGGKFAAVHALDQSIAESKPGKVGAIFLPLCTLADIGDFLEFRHTAIAVGGGEFTFFIQTLAVFDMDDLPGFGVMQHHVYEACDILPKICYQIACTVPEQFAGELFLFPHRHTLLGDPHRIGMFCFGDGLRPITGKNPGVIGFALLQIGFHHRAGADFKGFICSNDFDTAVCVDQLKLTPKCKPIAEIAVPAPPAVTDGGLPNILTFVK